jgi:hypothetical protein
MDYMQLTRRVAGSLDSPRPDRRPLARDNSGRAARFWVKRGRTRPASTAACSWWLPLLLEVVVIANYLPRLLGSCSVAAATPGSPLRCCWELLSPRLLQLQTTPAYAIRKTLTNRKKRLAEPHRPHSRLPSHSKGCQSDEVTGGGCGQVCIDVSYYMGLVRLVLFFNKCETWAPSVAVARCSKSSCCCMHQCSAAFALGQAAWHAAPSASSHPGVPASHLAPKNSGMHAPY